MNGKIKDGLILAAGLGSRIRKLSACKPLTPVCEISLLEISARQLARVGVSRLTVAVGHMADDLDAALPSIANKTGQVIEVARISDYSRPNGYSVISGAHNFNDQYLLVMADHILSDGILQALVNSAVPSRGVALAVDRRLNNPTTDMGDATLVRTNAAGKITDIGKDVVAPDAVDCGAFLASSLLSEAIEHAISHGKQGSLSDGMQRLADRRLAMAIDIGDAWWVDVDDPRAHNLAERGLFEHLPHLSERGVH